MTETVLIDFQADYSSLNTALEELSKAGKIDASGFTTINKAIKTTTTETKGLIGEFKKVATTATQLGKSVENAFGAGVQDALDEAGVSAQEFADALKKANQPAKSLKAELRELKEALALMKANGKDAGAEFDALRARAGLLQDAMADANAEIRNAGSDTRQLDNVVGAISGIAGGFAAAQGAAALFGNESEDVQKALLKVNGAMALAAGLQQFYNATLKEGSIAKLADSVATGTQVAVQKLYTLATGKATAATVAFKVALATTGIGLIVVAVLALVSALNDTEESLEDVNKQIEYQNELMESYNRLLDRQAELQVARAKAAGQAESAQIREQLKFKKAQFENISATNEILTKERAKVKNTSDAYFEYNKQIEKNIEAQEKLRHEIELLKIQGSGALADESAEAKKKAEEDAKKLKALREKEEKEAREARLQILRDKLAAIERELLFVEKGTQQEIDLKKKVIVAKRNIELEGEKITKNQIGLIRAQAYKDQLDLQEGFNQKLTEDQLKAQVDTNTALLSGIELNNEEKLRLQIENIAALAQIEINAAEGNAAKIMAIEAKKAADIRALKNAEIDRDLQRTIDASQKSNDIIKAALTKLADNTKENVKTRIAAAEGIGRQELVEVDRKIKANEEKEQSDQEYQDNYKKLADERAEIEQNTSDKINAIKESDKQKRQEELEEIAQNIIDIAGQVADFFSNLSALANEQERAQIDAQKRALEGLVEAGAITEKEARIRAQQIEVLERQAKQKQAQREKQIAVFNALLAIPQSVLQGLKTGGPVLAAIYGALAAAQAALVISRPVPKFFRGKKDRYEGPGEVADMGAELVERNGRMYLYTKPTKTYLGANDKVYTAAETRQILHNTNVNTTIDGVKADNFDYERLAKAIPQSSFNVNIDKDFIEESVSKGLLKTRYFNNRYKF